MSPEIVAPLIVGLGFLTAAITLSLDRRVAMAVRITGTIAIASLWLVMRLTDSGSVDSVFAVTMFGLAITALSEARTSRSRNPPAHSQ